MQFDRIREQCLQLMDEQYASQMEKLVDEMRLEDAESLVLEMMVEAEDFDDGDLFLDDLTEWSERDLKGIYFTDINDIDIDNG